MLFLQEIGQTAARRYTGMILVVIVLLTLFDISVDLNQGVEFTHILIEAIIIPLAAAGLFIVWTGLSHLRDENEGLRSDLSKVRSEAAQWREDADKYVRGLSEAIDNQLCRWSLSPAEKEIALLILKGLSHKEIAESRKTSERTVRQQALGIYGKSGLSGRADLAAFFLEDLLNPLPQNS